MAERMGNKQYIEAIDYFIHEVRLNIKGVNHIV